MKNNDLSPKLIGTVELTLTNKSGNIIKKVITHNAIVNLGMDFVLNRMADDNIVKPISYIGIGTGVTAVDSGDTTLVTERGRATVTYTESTVSTREINFSAYFEAAYPDTDYDISEIGLFGGQAYGSSDSGILVGRALITPITKIADQHGLTINYKISTSGG